MFNATRHYNNYVAGQIESGLEVTKLTQELGLHVHNLSPKSAFYVTSNCESNLYNTGDTICAQMNCRELTPAGNVRCMSPCETAYWAGHKNYMI